MPSPDPTPAFSPLIKALTSGEPISVRPGEGDPIGYIPVYRSPLPPPAPQGADAPDQSDMAPAYPAWAVQHPVPAETAKKFADEILGLCKDRVLWSQRRQWWALLNSTTDPDERLSCERMINALGEAIGRRKAGRGE